METLANKNQIVFGIDVGGTFTDVIAFDLSDGTIVAMFKVPSTPKEPEIGAIEGVDRFMRRSGKVASAVFHGTTVGTNTLIEKRGCRTALVASKGFGDVIELRRQARPRLYDLFAAVSSPLVPSDLRIEVDERILFDGSTLVPLDERKIKLVVNKLKALAPDAVAVSLMHAYANDDHERRIGDALRHELPNVFVTISSDVSREFREFERTSTAVVNAYIGPIVSDYLDSLERKLIERSVHSLYIVKSNGGLTAAANARRYPVHLIESGPAAGIIAAATLGEAMQYPNLIAFDMGGTTAKVGVIIGSRPRLSTEFYADQFVDGVDLGGYPIKSPVIDIIEIGAGGGSIARVDSAGVIKVGPGSSGAEPGPACYGRGGNKATITDAHVVLGHIAADGFGSEDIEINVDAARRVIKADIADSLGWSIEKAAWGVLQIANANMAELVRQATLRRGLDPRDFAMIAFGGAGPMHAADIAAEVGIPKILIPPLPGLFSAIGTMLGKMRHDLVQTFFHPTATLDPAQAESVFQSLERRAKDLIETENTVSGSEWSLERFADLRFERQLFEITLPLPAGVELSGAGLEGLFREAYLKTYGYQLKDNAVEIANLRLVAQAPIWSKGWVKTTGSDQKVPPERKRTVFDQDGQKSEIAVVPRLQMTIGRTLSGPLIVEDFGATIRVLSGQRVIVVESGVLEIQSATQN